MSNLTCSVEACQRPVKGRGYCSMHLQRLSRSGSLESKLNRSDSAAELATCSIAGCGSYAISRGWCSKHYQYWYKHGVPVAAEKSASCPTCGVVIDQTPKRGGSKTFCSKKCGQVNYFKHLKESGKYQERLEGARRGPFDCQCVECGGRFISAKETASFCSNKCGNSKRDRENPIKCAEINCDRGVRAKGLCAMHWRRKARAEGREVGPVWDDSRKAVYHARRALKHGTQVESIRPADVYERDDWFCGLCSGPVDPASVYPDPMSPSLDHVLPLSRGGSHTYENVQLAHLTCNLSKGNRIAA